MINNISDSTTDRDITEDMNDIVLNGFEIEDRVYFRYGVTFDKIYEFMTENNIQIEF